MHKFPRAAGRDIIHFLSSAMFIVSRRMDQAYTHFDSGKYLGGLEVCLQRVDGGGLLVQVVVKI